MIALLVTLFVFATHVSTPVLAQEGDQPPNEPQGLTIFTRYPAQEVAIGEDVTFDLKLRTDT
ncbi:MAG: hypothetical protein DRI79_10985, partial [Chloroflexi bacterium]